jgi:hypothetical protein
LHKTSPDSRGHKTESTSSKRDWKRHMAKVIDAERSEELEP